MSYIGVRKMGSLITRFSRLSTAKRSSFSTATAASTSESLNYDILSSITHSPTLPFFSSPYMHSTNNEDYLSELTILKHLYESNGNKKLNLLSICGGGDTITSFLNYDNIINKIDAVDMNESQLNLLDLKIKSMITFKDRDNCLKLLLSQKQNVDRIGLYDLIRGHLKCESRNFWDLRRNLDINYGIIGCSIYDRLLKLMIYGISLNKNKYNNYGQYTDIHSLSRQIEQSLLTYLDPDYLSILFNYKRRPRAFVNVERIAKNHKSLIENFYNIHNNKVFDNYFFTLIMNLTFCGKTGENGYPLWLQRNIYNELRKKYKNSYYVDKILEFHVGDVSEIGFKIAVNDNKYKYDYINLSNAMEWADVDYYYHIINILSKVLNNGGIIFHRFHLIKDDEIMRKQIILWNKALNDSNKFNIIDNNNPFKLNVLKNERSKFGFHPDCISIAVRK